MRAPELGDAEGAALVAAARRAVEEHLGASVRGAPPDVPSGRLGVFVTIGDAAGLRGCIGFPIAHGELRESLLEAAIAAATTDLRFEPVRAEELRSLTFEVSVLSAPEAIPGERSAYPSAIRIGRDGLMVTRGGHSGLLLPQVPAELSWDSEEFLGRACEKAGLGPDSWRDVGTEVQWFAATVFREESPCAPAVRA